MKYFLIILVVKEVVSPPSRRRGLKSEEVRNNLDSEGVASLAEAWIEIRHKVCYTLDGRVASLAEAWIEILYETVHFAQYQPSPPSRRRGLKLIEN